MMSNADGEEDGGKISLTSSLDMTSIDTMKKILNKKRDEILRNKDEDDKIDEAK